jgi:hypothetical protein
MIHDAPFLWRYTYDWVRRAQHGEWPAFAIGRYPVLPTEENGNTEDRIENRELQDGVVLHDGLALSPLARDCRGDF